MAQYPEWIKESIKDVKVEKVANMIIDIPTVLDSVDKKVVQALQGINNVLDAYDDSIQLAYDSNLVETANKLIDSKKQVIAFITENAAIRESLKLLKNNSLLSTATENIDKAIKGNKLSCKDLTREDFQTIKTTVAFNKSDEILKEAIKRYVFNHPVKATRETVTREDILRSDTYTVADPTAIGDKKRPLTIAMMGVEEKENNISEQDNTVVMYWEGGFNPLLKKEFGNKEKAGAFYDNYKLKLAEIQKLIEDENLDEAEKKTKEMLDVSTASTEPLIQDQSPIIKGR